MKKVLALILLTVFLAGCGPKLNLIKETYFPGDPGFLVGEFPKGTSTDDCFTTTTDGRLLVLVPVTKDMVVDAMNDKEAPMVSSEND